MSFKNSYILILVTFLFTFPIIHTLSDTVTNIEITTSYESLQISDTENYHIFSATFDKSQGKFILLSLTPTDVENDYNHIFVSIPGDDTTIPSYTNSDYKTVSKNTMLLIETSKINYNQAKIAIECKEKCDFNFGYEIVDVIPLIWDKNFDLILNSNEEFTLNYVPLEDEFSNKFTFFSNSPTDFELKIFYNNIQISPLTEFYNGYGLLINNILYPEKYEFTFKVNHYGKPKELIHISNRKILKNEYKNLAIGDFHSSITGLENYENDCFNLPKLSEESSDKLYNLNFMTYTKNIKVTLTDELNTKNEEILIQKESSVLQLNAKTFSKMCLSSYDNNIATTTFQLLDGTEQTINQDLQMSLYRGLPLNAKLNKNQIAYYKLNFYPSYSTKLIMNLKTIKGKAKLYYGICNSYPNCNFNVEKLSELETIKSVNDNMFLVKNIESNMSYPYNDPEFQAAVVYCSNESEDCEFYITLLNEHDELNLIENEKYYNSLSEGDNDFFQFNIYDLETKLNYLYVVLYSYTGNNDFNIYSDVDMKNEIVPSNYIAYGNKIISVINKDDLESKTLQGSYYIKVKANSNSFYSIYYYTKNDFDKNNYYFESDEVIIQNLSKNDGEKTFYLKNKLSSDKLFYEFEGLNCELKAELNSEIFEGRKHQFILENNTSEYIEMKINVKNYDIETNDDALCLFTLTGGDYSENEEIILTDGIIKNSQLNNNINFINYIYPILPDISSNQISVHFTKFNSYNIDLSYAFGEETYNTINIKTNEKKLLFNNDEIEKKCSLHSESYCALRIQIKLSENISLKSSEYVDFTIIVNNDITYPSYLPKNNFIKNILQTNQYQYHYIDIGQNQEIELNIDFSEGEGQAILKVVKKDEIEEGAEYLRRIILPKLGMNDTLNINQYNKNIIITKNLTEKCENGCEVYIGILQTDQKFPNKINVYSIYYRDLNNNNEVVNVPENNEIHGNLNSVNDLQIFRTQITKNTISFNAIGENIFVYINKGESIPTKEQSNYKLNSNTKEPLIIESNEEDIFTYIVTTTELNGEYSNNYYLKITSYENNIIPIDFKHNSHCHFSSTNTKCNYILTVENYIIEDKLYLYTPDNSNTFIYANSMPITDFDNLSPEDQQKQLPTKQSISTNYLIFYLDQKNVYLLITVESNIENSDATLVIGEFNKPSSSFLNSNNYNFYALNENNFNSINLIIQGENLFKVTFNLINNGKGIIEQSQLTKTFELNNDANKQIQFYTDSELRRQKIFTVNFDDSNVDLYFYVTLEQRHKSNFDNFDLSNIKEQKFEYLQNDESKIEFPLSFYSKISDFSDSQFLLQIFSRVSIEEDKLSNKLLHVDGYIVDDKFINDRKKNPQAEISSDYPKYLGLYDLNTLTSVIKFTNVSKYFDNNYFYITIYEDSTEEKIGEFSYLELNMLNTYFEYANHYNYSIHNTNAIQTKNLLLIPEMGENKMAIEFNMDEQSTNNYNFSINQYTSDDTDYSRNSTYIIESSENKNGKKRIYVYLNSNCHYIVFNVINKDNLVKNDSYIIKYRIESSNPTYCTLPSQVITYNLQGKNLHIEFESVREDSTHTDFKVKYYLRFYDKEKLGNIDSIETIYVKENYLYQFEKEVQGDETKNVLTYDFEIEENNGKEQIMYLVAYASYEKNEEIISYDSVVLKYDNNNNDEGYVNLNEFWVTVFVFMGVIVVSFGVVFVYLFAKNDVHKRPGVSNSYLEISKVKSTSENLGKSEGETGI